jgi:hypothetical protein
LPHHTGSQTGAGSLRAYARHRGCSHQAVRKAIVGKRLLRSIATEGGRVTVTDFQLADREWETNTHALKVRSRSRSAKSATAPAPAPAVAPAIEYDGLTVGVDDDGVAITWHRVVAGDEVWFTIIVSADQAEKLATELRDAARRARG